MDKFSKLTGDELAELSAKVLADKEGGMSYAAIGAKYGLNHTQVDRISYAARITDEDREAWFASAPSMGERAVKGREDKISWGMMGILEGVPETRIRAEFAKATNNKSQGQRIGKGGRYYQREELYYEDVLKPTGTTIPVGTPREKALVLSKAQRFGKLDQAGQDAIGASVGVPWVKGSGKSRMQWERAVLAALVGDEPTPTKAKAPRKKAAAASRKQAALPAAPKHADAIDATSTEVQASA